MWSLLGPRRGGSRGPRHAPPLLSLRVMWSSSCGCSAPPSPTGLGGNYQDCLGGVNAPRGSMFLHTITGFSDTSEALARAIRWPDGTLIFLFRSNSEDQLLHLAIYNSADSVARHSFRARLSLKRILFRILWNTLGSSGTDIEQMTLILFKFAILFEI